MMGVTYWIDEDNMIHCTIYTENFVYKTTGRYGNVFTPDGKLEESINGIGAIPIIEYKMIIQGWDVLKEFLDCLKQ